MSYLKLTQFPFSNYSTIVKGWKNAHIIKQKTQNGSLNSILCKGNKSVKEIKSNQLCWYKLSDKSILLSILQFRRSFDEFFLIASNHTCTVIVCDSYGKLWQGVIKKKEITFNFDVSKKHQHNCLEYFLSF